LLNPRPISLGILPVRISAKGGKRSVEGYAFLDNGSTGTIFLECLVDQLDADATPTILNCETMNAATREECVTLDLRIESLDGSGYVECIHEKILLWATRVFQHRIKFEGLSTWKILIFKNCQTRKFTFSLVLMFLSLIAHWRYWGVQEKSHYGLKSILGWTIHGPLARVSSNMASFHYIQTSTKHPDDALDEDIQKMFRIDFADHDLRSQDLSIEDRFAVKIIKESTVHLPDGHYQVALPFKPNGEKVFDSHAAESYQGSLGWLKWLKKRFQKDPKLFKKYTAKIHKLQDSGFSKTIEI
jgi:hypothetical protein